MRIYPAPKIQKLGAGRIGSPGETHRPGISSRNRFVGGHLRDPRPRIPPRPEIAGANGLFRASVPQVFLDIDDAKVLKLGVPLDDVNTTIGAFLGGAYVNDFNRFGRLYKVYVQAEPDYRTDAASLRAFGRRYARVMLRLQESRVK